MAVISTATISLQFHRAKSLPPSLQESVTESLAYDGRNSRQLTSLITSSKQRECTENGTWLLKPPSPATVTYFLSKGHASYTRSNSVFNCGPSIQMPENMEDISLNPLWETNEMMGTTLKVVNNKALTCSSTLRSRLSDMTDSGTCTKSLPRPGALRKKRKEDPSALEIVGPGSVTHRNLNAEGIQQQSTTLGFRRSSLRWA